MESDKQVMRKIGYARVSTADQSLGMQIDAMLRYGVHKDLIFTDKLSGAKTTRPGLIEALRFAQIPGTEFVVWKLDRLGRSILGIIETLQLLDERGVVLYSLTERIDLSTPFGKAMVNILAAFAQFERDMIRERTTAGIKRHLERGGEHGRPVVMIEPRIELATKMLKDGKHIARDILPALQAIPGPTISRSALYMWTRQQRRLAPKHALEDR